MKRISCPSLKEPHRTMCPATATEHMFCVNKKGLGVWKQIHLEILSFSDTSLSLLMESVPFLTTVKKKKRIEKSFF